MGLFHFFLEDLDLDSIFKKGDDIFKEQHENGYKKAAGAYQLAIEDIQKVYKGVREEIDNGEKLKLEKKLLQTKTKLQSEINDQIDRVSFMYHKPKEVIQEIAFSKSVLDDSFSYMQTGEEMGDTVMQGKSMKKE